MKLNKLYNQVFILLIASVMWSCQEHYSLGDLKTPTNLTVSFEIVGVDDSNPYGDGSGLVNFTADADDYITFHFIFGDGKDDVIKQDGKVEHLFSVNGINTYNVTVIAVGTGGITTSKTVEVEVYSSFTDEEAVEFLTGGNTKKWYWAADQPGHVGLGPNSEDAGKSYASWWSAAAWEKDCMYDAEFTFTKTDNGLTYEQTAGKAFIPGTYAGKIGVTGDVCHDETVTPTIYGIKNVSFSPSSSIATEAGGYRGTTMSFSDAGFMCWYVGKSEFEIIEVTNNIIKLRVAEDDTYAWYLTFSSVKPIQ